MTRTTNPKRTAIVEFTGDGVLWAILLNAPNDEGQRILEKALGADSPFLLGLDQKAFNRIR